MPVRGGTGKAEWRRVYPRLARLPPQTRAVIVCDQKSVGYETRQTIGREMPGMLTDVPSRFSYMWEFLGLPWKDVELLSPGNQKAKI